MTKRISQGAGAGVLLLFAAACGDLGASFGPYMPSDGGIGGDGAVRRPTDASPPSDGPIPPGPMQADEIPEAATDVTGAARTEWLAGCFDGVDADGDDRLDCEETTCQVATSACCVGIASDACCAPPSASVSLDFGTCTSGAPAACTAGATAFGSATPYVVEMGALAELAQNAIVMNGSDDSDSGLVLTRVVDFTSRRVALSARIGVPATCGAGCLQTAAIAVTARGDYMASRPEHVRPLLALIVSASLRQVLLVQGDAVVASTGIVSDVATYELSLEPGGDVVVTGGAEPLATRWAPTSTGHIALYGRNVNPSMGMPLPARFETLTVAEGLCDMPRAWGARRQAVPQLSATMPPTSTWTDAPRIVRAPSAAVRPDDGARVVAFETERGIYLGGESMDGTSYSPLMGGNVALMTGRLRDGTAASHVGEPSLVPAASGTEWDLYVTVSDGAGAKRWIARTTRTLDATDPFPEATPISVTLDGLGADAELSSPEVVFTGATLELFARLGTGGESRLVHFLSVDSGATWAPPGGGTLQDATVWLPSGGSSAFDGDDVSGPAVVRQNGAWELYFTGRRGARTAIGVLSSFDLVHWWDAGRGEPVLSASGAGFDALSVGEPAAFSLGDSVVLLYGGTDGADWRIGRVERAAASHRGR